MTGLLRDHLATVLTARTAEVRSVTCNHALAVTDRCQFAECRQIADEILLLRLDPELAAFAVGLRDRLDYRLRWRRGAPHSVFEFAALLLLLARLPFVGAVLDSDLVTAVCVVTGAALVFAYVPGAPQAVVGHQGGRGHAVRPAPQSVL